VEWIDGSGKKDIGFIAAAPNTFRLLASQRMVEWFKTRAMENRLQEQLLQRRQSTIMMPTLAISHGDETLGKAATLVLRQREMLFR